MIFPEKFIWGAAAASYQIEGAAYEDGKGLSVWDVFCKWPGRVENADTGDVACDHYHRYEEDVAIMQEIGLHAYRLSISWPRVMSNGTGAVNEKGLAFYDRLIDALLKANITPYVTLFHWDFPYALYQRGGWMNRDVTDWFAGYADVIVRRLGDRVAHWMTLNEPAVFIVAGHSDGRHAPGDRRPRADIIRMAHHVMLAHGKACQVIRAGSPQPCQIGVANVGANICPASMDEADIKAAKSAMFDGRDLWAHSWWSDPMILGHYPASMVDYFGADMVEIQAGDMDLIRQPVDFFGLNLYFGVTVKAGENGLPEMLPKPAGRPLTMFNWDVLPEALYWAPKFLYERYQLPIIVTENGLACMDWVALDGKVHDAQRIDFLTRYLKAFGNAGREGVDIRGYFQWSIMDNFEWAEGYKHRFGLVHVDYHTQKRTLKDSAYWYAEVIKSNGGILEGV